MNHDTAKHNLNITERIEDLERSIEWTKWLVDGELYFDDKFLRDRLVSMKAELAGLKIVNAERVSA